MKNKTYVWILVTFNFFLWTSFAAADEKPQADAPKINPLEITTPDPLLPELPEGQTLSPVERETLSTALDQLNTQATAQRQAGDLPLAYDTWNRELRLRRALGVVEEVQALGRVGNNAWTDNQRVEIQLITGRLQAIQMEAQAKPPVNLALLEALGEAYQQVRVPGSALDVYQQILADARQRQDQTAVESTLKTIVDLQMSWFDYPKAAATYEELLTIAQARSDRPSEVLYLKQLAYIYDQSNKPQQALEAKQKLIVRYFNYPSLESLIPSLKIAIASDYEALEQPNQAGEAYQEAYQLAMSRQQFAYASQALQKLANLYRTNNQPEYALQIYQTLLQIDQLSYDDYGRMNAYDQIGQIYIEQKNYPLALAAFQQGLQIAKALNYQEAYFTTQIEQVSQQRVQ
jgi:tetratricopeptide (TPR) repeat protein